MHKVLPLRSLEDWVIFANVVYYTARMERLRFMPLATNALEEIVMTIRAHTW
jgi:hypothetical protein